MRVERVSLSAARHDLVERVLFAVRRGPELEAHLGAAPASTVIR
jgi:hypothetical protein